MKKTFFKKDIPRTQRRHGRTASGCCRNSQTFPGHSGDINPRPRPVPQKPPQAAGPCSWACCRLHAPPSHSERNAADPPPACGAGLRLHGANGTGWRHRRPAGGRPLLMGRPPSARTTVSFGTKRSAQAPCSWGLGASTSSQRHWLAALPPLPAPRISRPAFCPARGRSSDRG